MTAAATCGVHATAAILLLGLLNLALARGALARGCSLGSIARACALATTTATGGLLGLRRCGIATALLKGCDLAGRVKNYDMAVLEVDERSAPKVYPYVKPEYIAARVKSANLDGVDVACWGIDKDYISALKSRGLYVAVWTVNNPKDMEKFVEWGVDSITTDKCGDFIKILSSKHSKP